MASLHDCLAACFSPAEFIAEVLATVPAVTSLRAALLPGGTVTALVWFEDLVATCERHGVFREAAFWTHLQRARPLRCGELHRFRRQHLARGDEPDPPRVAAVDAVVAAIARQFDTPAAIADVLDRSGWRGTLPPTGSATSLLHWVLISLVRAGDGATLFRLAALASRHGATLEAAAALLDRLAICACDGEIPAALQCAWMDVQPGPGSVDVSFRAWQPEVAVHGRLPADERPAVRTLTADLSLSVALSPSGRDLELQLRAGCSGPWIGRTLRLCSGVHSLFRRLMAPGGDRLGESGEQTVVLLERLALEGSI